MLPWHAQRRRRAIERSGGAVDRAAWVGLGVGLGLELVLVLGVRGWG